MPNTGTPSELSQMPSRNLNLLLLFFGEMINYLQHPPNIILCLSRTNPVWSESTNSGIISSNLLANIDAYNL